MASDKTSEDKELRVNLRLSPDEMTRFMKVLAAIQRRVGQNVRVTQKATFLEAVSMLEAYYDKLERDRQRGR